MLLAIDIGNTNLTLGYFHGRKLQREERLPTGTFKRLPAKYLRPAKKVIISSVVPRLDGLLKRQIKQPCYFVDPCRMPLLKIRLKKKAEIGADRLVNAVAVKLLYGGPAIIIDFGTATTFCAVNKRGEYLGGVIAPGIELSRRVLHERTAKLPLIRLQRPAHVIGQDTVSAMTSGLVLGYASLVEGLVKLITEEMRQKYRQKGIKVIATGGYAALINKFLKKRMQLDPHLTLKGLQLIAEEVFQWKN